MAGHVSDDRYDVALEALKLELGASDSITTRCVAVAALSGVIIGLLGAFSRVWLSSSEGGEKALDCNVALGALVVLLLVAVGFLLGAVVRALSGARPYSGESRWTWLADLCVDDNEDAEQTDKEDDGRPDHKRERRDHQEAQGAFPHAEYHRAVEDALKDPNTPPKSRAAEATIERFKQQSMRNRRKARRVRSAYSFLLLGIIVAALHVATGVVTTAVL